MDYIMALIHILILAIVVASLVSVILMRQTGDLGRVYISVEVFLFAMLTASIIDMPLYNNYAFFNIHFDKIVYDVGWHALCICYSFLWIVVVSRFLTGIKGKIVKKINNALIISYITSGMILLAFIPDMYDPILYAFNAIITMLLLVCTALGISEVHFKTGNTFTIPMTLISLALAIEGIYEMFSDTYNEGIGNFYAVIWAFSSILIMYAVMKESKLIKERGKGLSKNIYIEEEVIAELKSEYSLTDRETELIALILKGMSNTEIADALYIGGATVKTHIHNILNKMELNKKTDIIVLVKEKMKGDDGDGSN
ncbi:MAG: helix-turn-helix transcriptional regulator [Clostridia bacterium]|nr:helix-turn-helix transcriptional regulator [Clostridia bacterium]